MATMVSSAPSTGSGMPAAPVPRHGSRWARWLASWRLSLRMARRDVRRHKGRSVLVLIMVSVPVALLVAAACWGAVGQVSGPDLIPSQMGSGQALIQQPQDQRVAQLPDALSATSNGTAAKPVPGYHQGKDNTAAVQRLTGGRLVPVMQAEARLVEGDRRIRIQALVVDGRADLGPKAELTSGRWGTDSSEIVVTPAGHANGLPDKGTATVSAGGVERTITVVGTGDAFGDAGGQVDVVVPRSWDPAQDVGQSWILKRDKAMPWSEVRSLNEYGIVASSAAVLTNPPSDAELDPMVRGQANYQQGNARMIAAVGGAMLFLITTLLVGPAFAVSASRQRRTLALAASNGAETRQLRRSVLAQALLLGAFAAVAGAVIGGFALWAAMRVWRATHPATSIGSFQVPWLAMAIVVPCAVLSALTAALIPSLRLKRLDIVGVMRGQSVSPPVNKVLPVLGAALTLVGGVFLVYSVKTGGREIAVLVGAFALVIGALLTVPALLGLAGRLAASLPAASRIATRDAARHRSRSTPTIAAILAGVAALTAFSIGLASDTQQRMRDYTPQALPGEGFVSGRSDKQTSVDIEQALDRDAPGLIRTPLRTIGFATVDPAAAAPFVVAVPHGCSIEKALSPSAGADTACTALGTTAASNGQIMALSLDELTRRFDLTPPQRRAMRDGAIAVAVPDASSSATVDIARGTAVEVGQTGDVKDVKVLDHRSVPAIRLSQDTIRNVGINHAMGAAVTVETAQRLKWPLVEESVLLRDPNGAISDAVQTKLDESLGDEAQVYVERGFVRDDAIVMEVMFGIVAALLLIVTLISTSLSLAEQQSDMGTFAAVGATRGTRRWLAASQAMVVGFVGAVLGIVVGLFPGIAVTYPLTATSWDQYTGQEHHTAPTLAIPWLPLVAVVVGVPLLAGLLSALAIRRAPTITRRVT